MAKHTASTTAEAIPQFKAAWFIRCWADVEVLPPLLHDAAYETVNKWSEVDKTVYTHLENDGQIHIVIGSFYVLMSIGRIKSPGLLH